MNLSLTFSKTERACTMNRKPYLVTIEETSRRTVVVWADNADGDGLLNAESIAEDLCNDGTINLDYDDFQERSCVARSILPTDHTEHYEKYDEDGKLL